MTAICSGGTSSARAGFSESLFVGPAAIAALLNNVPTPWAVGLAAFIGHITYNLSTFCTVDPPTLPTFTALDGVDLLNVYDPVRNVPAAAKFQDLVGYYLWFQVCHCDSVVTPAPAAAPAEPAGFPQLNPSVAPPVTESNACFSTTRLIRIADVPLVAGAGSNAWNLTPYMMTPNGVQVQAYVGATIAAADFPPGAVRFRSTTRTISGGPATLVSGGQVKYEDSPTHALGFGGIDLAPNGQSATSSMRTVVGAPTLVTIQWDFQPALTNLEFELTLEFFCTTSPGSEPVTPCCPPDPILDGQLQQILGLVTLIQRQLAPFSYIGSTAHAGLTGNGSIAVQGLIGARFQITADSDVQGELAGDPTVRSEVGWFNWGNADGVTAREFLNANQQLSFPAAAGQYTAIHYSLGVGVTLTITELEREP